MKYKIIKHYKVQEDGSLEFVKEVKRPLRKKRTSHNVTDSCFNRNHLIDGNDGMNLYDSRTIVTKRVRTSQHPDGKLMWREVFDGSFWLDPKSVKLLGTVGAYRAQEKAYFEHERSSSRRKCPVTPFYNPES